MKSICLPILFGLLALPAFADKDDKKADVPDVSLDQVRWGEVVNDVEFDEGSLEGKVVVVEHWGVKCPPCIASLPDLAKMSKRYAKKGLVVVGLERQGSSKEEILDVIKKPRVKYAIMSGGNVPVKSNGIPHAAVFDHTGKLVWHGNPHDDEFEDSVKDALKAIPKA
ncbi:TlpA family protein disulfide reductase [Haloferula sp.]|uniref:TlpA family protein disulfide reductase n=1 Tax=Haloferula sp. TaxID=2497595 RepID=UPI00329B2203